MIVAASVYVSTSRTPRANKANTFYICYKLWIFSFYEQEWSTCEQVMSKMIYKSNSKIVVKIKITHDTYKGTHPTLTLRSTVEST
jgi:hypothetical protein